MLRFENKPGTTVQGYVVGRTYRVARPGGCLLWDAPAGHGALTLGRTDLPVGTVLTFLGEFWGWGSDPGVEMRFVATVDGREVRGQFCPSTFDPYFSHPLPGYLELGARS